MAERAWTRLQTIALGLGAVLAAWNVYDTRVEPLRWVFGAIAVGLAASVIYKVCRPRAIR